MLVLTLLCHGCPLQAIVVAFGFDERTVARWQARAGYHCQRVHEHLVSQGSVELGHVQADELWVKRVGRRVWMAMALAVPSSLGLGYARRRVVKVVQRVVRGTAEAIAVVLATTGGGTAINTAYIERLNATFRSALAPLVRRGRAIAHKEAVLTAGMCLVGCAYNFCWYHASLRLVAPEGTHRKWQERTPAMAAGLTNHRWAMRELLLLKIPWPAGVVPEQCRRPPKQKQQPLMAMAA